MSYKRHPFPARTALAFACAATLVAGCATTSPYQAQPTSRVATRAPAPSIAGDWDASAQALRAQRWSEAREPLSRLLQQDLRNGHLQFLHALVEENEARDTDRARLELAAVGYANANRFAPGHYWALLHQGFIDLDRHEYTSAQALFAEAVLDQPQRWEAFYGLGVASYYRRDLPMLHLAAQRAVQLAPEHPDALRLQAMAMAVQGDPAAAGLAQRSASGMPAPLRAHLDRRVGEMMLAARSVPVSDFGQDFGQDFGDPDPFGIPALAAGDPNQVVVEVTILLNSTLDTASRGINLFDGLRILYGYSNTLASTFTSFGRESTRSITSQISSPQLDYSLNLFNDSGQYYSVVARPSITAHLGRESQFFAGRTLNVEVSGINLGQLQPIDVGVQLKVTPEQIDGQKVTFQIAAERSFLSQQQIGTFENSLTTFRQSVSATADVEFGQTLVLSALSEEVSDRSYSKVPGAGDVPVVNWFTRRSQDSTRQESLLILVTPKLPLSISTPDTPERRQRTTQALLQAWQQRIDPRSDVPAILQRLQRMRWLRAPEPGDLSLRLPQSDQLQREAVEESLLLARR